MQKTMDLTTGSIPRKVILFSLPLLGTMILQLLFNAVDVAVVGRFASHRALAAVGSTSSLIALLVNLLVGISVGCNVVAANAFGAKDRPRLDKVLHTAMTFSLVAGVLLGILGILLARPLLTWMNTPPDVLDGAVLYMRIYFAGMPFLQVYNFGSAILRAVGDTRRPFLFLVISGFLNAGLNLFLVAFCHRTVDGVALATIISEALAMVLVWRALGSIGDGVRLEWRRLGIHWGILGKILAIGVPAGIQSCCFSFSNVVIQSAINSFGSQGVAGCAAALIWECLVWTGSYCYNQTATSFVAQNLGARNIPRVRSSIRWCILIGTTTPAVLGLLGILFAAPLLRIFNDDPQVIQWGIQRMRVVLSTYAILGVMDSLSGAIRGTGRSVFITVVMLVGVCGFRVLWTKLVFPCHPTISFLFTSYPLSWLISLIPMGIYLHALLKKMEDMGVTPAGTTPGAA
ncbi:MAG: MATE family efflux transporter [Oligosphaeraceae bacterium]